MNRKIVASVITGALLIVAGICAFGQAAGYWNLATLLSGWWTLFLIVPAVAGMIVSGPRPGNVCLLLLGLWLFAECHDWLGGMSRTMLLGIFLVVIGISVLTGWGRKPGDRRRHRHHDSFEGEGAQHD